MGLPGHRCRIREGPPNRRYLWTFAGGKCATCAHRSGASSAATTAGGAGERAILGNVACWVKGNYSPNLPRYLPGKKVGNSDWGRLYNGKYMMGLHNLLQILMMFSLLQDFQKSCKKRASANARRGPIGWWESRIRISAVHTHGGGGEGEIEGFLCVASYNWSWSSFEIHAARQKKHQYSVKTFV